MERRTYRRVACDTPVTVDPGGDPQHLLTGRARNVSEVGMMVLLPEPLPLGLEVVLIYLPAATIAEVVWSALSPEDEPPHAHGLRFFQPNAQLAELVTMG